jgi:hypothetical protein
MEPVPTPGVLGAADEDVRYRPRVSRETRRLLITAALALLTLSVLARFRFPDRPPTPNPVLPLLSQLSAAPTFSDLAASIEDARLRLAPWLVALMPADPTRAVDRPMGRIAAIRIGDDRAVAILPAELRGDERARLGVIVADPSTGLAVVNVRPEGHVGRPAIWIAPDDLDTPRYLIATSPSQTGVSLSPSFVASLSPVEAIGWSQRIWAVPGDASITAGTFLFDENALLAGVATTYGAGIAIVPSDVLLAAADDLMKSPPNQPGDLGIEVQELTPSLSIASGAESGVVVSWVDPNGAANRLLMAGDVITGADGMAIMTTEQWRVRAARTAPKQTVMVTALRRGQRVAVMLTAPAAAERSGTSTLGLTLRLVPRVGSEVVSVDRGSAAATSGIEAGDIITAISSASAPSPAEVRRAFASAVRGAPLIVALTRGSSHRVVAVPR